MIEIFFYLYFRKISEYCTEGIRIILDKMSARMKMAEKTSVVIREYDSDDADINGMQVHVIYKCQKCGNLMNISMKMIDLIPGMASHSLVKGYCNWCTPDEEQKEKFKLLYSNKSKNERSISLY